MPSTALLACRVLFYSSLVTIELERLTGRTTRMRVTAKHGAIFRDRSTAGEIIAQTERALDELPAVSHRAR